MTIVVATVTIAACFRQCLIPIFFLSNRIGIGLSTFGTKTNECVFCILAFLQLREAVGKGLAEDLSKIAHSDTVLGTAWPGQAWLDSPQIKVEQVIKLWLSHLICTEKSLGLAVAFNQVNQLWGTPGFTQIAQRLV